MGYDPKCQQSELWMRMMSVDSLKYGRGQPFYHVLPDSRDRPAAQVAWTRPHLFACQVVYALLTGDVITADRLCGSREHYAGNTI